MAQFCDSNGFSIKAECETNDVDWVSELDYIPLGFRRQLLLARKLNSCSPDSQSTPQTIVIKKGNEEQESDWQQVSPINKDIDQQSVQPESHETGASSGVDPVVACNKIQVDCDAADKCAQNATAYQLAMQGDCDSCWTKVNRSFYSDQSLLGGSMIGSIGANVEELKLKINNSDDFVDDLDHIVLKERHRMLLSRKMLRIEKPILEETSYDALDNVPASTNSVSGSTLLNLVRVKAEPLNNNESNSSSRNASGNFSFNIVQAKTEIEFPDELNRDNIDHMQLRNRMKLLTPREDSKLNSSGNFECLRKSGPSVDNDPAVMEASNPIRINRPRKRKKTATDSIETALEEDAPGLLQVLVEQGVSVDEIKLYGVGDADNDEAIDESLIEDGFAELEDVMSKIFFQRNSFLKFATLRCTKGTKASYCLACLFSLVEQTRYLQFRNWPAEWGWCRDIQSFIFVFERHRRIVLERPEYGYATYFFELVDSLSIDWQIKRLVTAMKLTNCGRITLIENKTLLVGEDLTEGEAQVLMQYGWTPNSGIGTMLNYCDRVVHDRKNEKESSEWRSKIGKLLMDGYNGGSIVSSNVQENVIQSEVDEGEGPQSKMEL
ncbi:hypothetical protein P3X46_029437 [Hevea brasiliensis]|uniref:Uncharacterized protein n=2 Tax=Hevea brasiliensis TaxID=3981 RepID=A0ABQ9KU96_HEVBR|nr:uncharacterized protein LOC110635604 isoform X1 [Hevea brasiliensis]XP_021640700.2 uncharacterized protein LOC110635604 isoform X1 [Hevea brasiliensis]XP_021640701.2 uncharacterized protein LOC110635604 isoform X1 [Hevea brasiliensis]KAJ9147259.1 hypothetical protein P3X46_029437 [Hevea brasiliensis]KAJ9147260.1 hypothetical protein P3X46_029437 [Hevea brasiliensis]